MSESQQSVTVGDKSFAAMAAEFRRLHAEDYAPAPQGSFAASQYAAAVGITQDAATCTLRRLVARGKAEAVGKFRISGGHEAMHYRLTSAPQMAHKPRKSSQRAANGA